MGGRARAKVNLTLTLYRRIDGPQAISVELLGPAGDAVAAASTTLIVEPRGQSLSDATRRAATRTRTRV